MELAQSLHGCAIGDGRPMHGRINAVIGCSHGGVRFRLHADHPHMRREGARGDRHSGNEPVAADGRDDPVELRLRLDHFECHRAFSGDDGRIVIGVNESHLALRGDAQRPGRAIFGPSV
jgi:hypothetical protein